jgi:cytochrome c-type biogenesis protein CcmE
MVGDGTMKVVKLKGPVVTAIVASLAMAGVVGAFVSNSSPYVTIAQARQTGGDSLHLAGEMEKGSFTRHMDTGHITFNLKDKDGAVVTVEHVGSQPASLLDADKLVAIGAMRGNRFVSRDLLVKCPTKYDEKKADPLASRS